MRHESSISDGWLAGARRVPSPHYFDFPEREISLLVIHSISLPPGMFSTRYIDQFFAGDLGPDAHPYFREIHLLKVAAHLLIDRQGAVTQYVPFDRCARHAGESTFEGRPRCNEYSVGIELEGTDDSSFTDAQYEKLAEITKVLRHQWPAISLDRIVGHSDIAPGRKTDPGPCFDWRRLRDSLV